MPTIACPGCGKQYKLPDSAAGQVAKCACGKKFKVGASSGTVAAPATAKAPAPKVAAPSAKSATAAAKSASVSKAAAATKAKVAATAASRSAAPAVAPIDDDFWDEGLKEPVHSAAPPAPATKPAGHSSGAAMPRKPQSATADATPKKKKKRKSGGVKWGFDWGKVIGGLTAFIVFGGLAAALFMASGRPSRALVYLALPAVGGLFTAINGLMGEEGIW